MKQWNVIHAATSVTRGEVRPMIQLAYAETSDGAWLIFYGSLDTEFLPIQRCFESLSRKSEPIALSELPDVVSDSITLVACCSDGPVGIERSEQDRSRFHWSQPPESWRDDASRLAMLVASDVACHQHLSSGNPKVVVSRGEYIRGWFSSGRN